MQLSNYFDNLIRDGIFDVLGIIDSDTSRQMLTYIDDIKYIEKLLSKNNVSCVLTNAEIARSLSLEPNVGLVISKNPRMDFFKLHNLLSLEENYCGNKYNTIIGANCQISKLSYVSPTNVTIGKNAIIEEFVSIKENTIIGDNCIIRAGCVIGSSGFEYKKIAGTILSVEHVGKVTIGDHVEIKCNSVIDKAIYPWDSTIIGDFSKIDNLVHIGHAVKIGKRVLIPAMSVIGGRVVIKDDSWIGIGSALRNGLVIGEKSKVNMGSVVTKNVKDNEVVSGNWAIDHQDFIKLMKERGKITKQR